MYLEVWIPQIRYVDTALPTIREVIYSVLLQEFISVTVFGVGIPKQRDAASKENLFTHLKCTVVKAHYPSTNHANLATMKPLWRSRTAGPSQQYEI